jgi:hypothetical protein
MTETSLNLRYHSSLVSFSPGSADPQQFFPSCAVTGTGAAIHFPPLSCPLSDVLAFFIIAIPFYLHLAVGTELAPDVP